MKYNNIEIIINWDQDPTTVPGATQKIYSPISKNLPDKDYSVYVGKVIDKIYINQYNHVVLLLRLPNQEDLNPENLNRKPISQDLKEVRPSKPETIMERPSAEEIFKMKQELIEAERNIKNRR